MPLPGLSSPARFLDKKGFALTTVHTRIPTPTRTRDFTEMISERSVPPTREPGYLLCLLPFSLIFHLGDELPETLLEEPRSFRAGGPQCLPGFPAQPGDEGQRDRGEAEPRPQRPFRTRASACHLSWADGFVSFFFLFHFLKNLFFFLKRVWRGGQNSSINEKLILHSGPDPFPAPSSPSAPQSGCWGVRGPDHAIFLHNNRTRLPPAPAWQVALGGVGTGRQVSTLQRM